MGRQNTRMNPTHKSFHTYHDFTGGLNTVDTEEKLKDNELPNLLNVDIGERGSLKRRTGFTSHIVALTTGQAQGLFRYFREGSGYEEIIAQNGYLYKDGTQQTITGLTQLQTTRPIEAVQFRDKLYIATGTKLVEYDGSTFQVVSPYAPEPLEALYIGTNALADDPDNFMQNAEGSALRIDGVTFNRRYGVVNQPIELEVFITQVAGTTIEYRYEYRTEAMKEGYWEQLTDGNYIADSSFSFELDIEGDISIRVWAKETGQSEGYAKQYLIPKYKIKPVSDPNDEDVPNDTIHSCNRIVLHWNRLILYGDTNQPDAIFISHLNNPNYFPVPNSLIFESEQRDPITSIVRYRDMLVVFTTTSIQALYGKSPYDYKRVMLNSSVGCIAPYSTTIVENYIAFLSNEGVHFLMSVGYNETRMNVEKIDTNIHTLISKSEDACGIVYDHQYHLVFPSEKTRLRFYYDRGVWTKDQSDKLDFIRMYEWNGELYGLRSDGQILKASSSSYNDDGHMYSCRIVSKHYNFNEPYHPKRLKEIQLIMGSQNEQTPLRIKVYADQALVLGGETSRPTVQSDGTVVWTYENNPNMTLYSGTTLGEWSLGNSPFGTVDTELYKAGLSGKCRHVKVDILQENDDAPIQLVGLGLKFKTKKP